jgi:uncharacterized DUF497 family protein
LHNESIKLRLGDLAFTWDDAKAELNFKKHGVLFELAVEVFLDEHFLEEENYQQGELRFQILGRTSTLPIRLLFVVFVERIAMNGENVVRVISARKASRKERIDYETKLGSEFTSCDID